MKKVLVLIGVVVLFSMGISTLAFSAEEKKATGKPAPAVTVPTTPALPPAEAMKQAARPRFGIISGSITKIDNSDPAKPKLEIKSETDSTVHNVEITPFTRVTKITDLSEIKAGDTVRVMTRKLEDTEVATAVVFGNIKSLPMATRARPEAPGTKTATPPPQTKK